MKRILVIITALAVTFSSVACVNVGKSTRKLSGSGNLITKTIDLPDYTSIVAGRIVDVVITNTSSDKIYIQADDNVMDYVVITSRNGELKCTIDPKINSIQSCKVEIRIPNNGKITRLEANASADITTTGIVTCKDLSIEAHSSADIEGRFRAGKCSIEAHSSADVDIELEADDVTVEAHSSAKVELRGSARSCNASLHSAADFEALRFAVENYEISASSAAAAEVNCSGLLKATASSAGSIEYTGDCRVESQTSSAGSVSKK